LISIPETAELYDLWPVLVPVATIGLVLFSAMTIEQKLMKRFLVLTAVLGLLISVLSSIKRFPMQPVSLLNESIVFDNLSLVMSIFLSLFLLGIITLSNSLWKKPSWEWPIFLSLLLGSLVGMILLCSTKHLIFFAIAVELASMPSYVLVGFRRFNPKSAEGSAKYVIFGAVCSAIMIYGISLLYGLAGSFDIMAIAVHLPRDGMSVIDLIALLCLFIGIGFKLSLVPMHFWCPDAFEAAGADVAAWLSVASKAAVMVALWRFIHPFSWIPAAYIPNFNHILISAITILAIVTMTVANLSAYYQTSVKRLLAYSSIAHAGYIFSGLAILTNTTGISAILAYFIIYALMNLGAFTVAGVVEMQTGTDSLKSFSDLGRRSPALAVMMMFFLFSLVGLPPLAGFSAKWILLSVLWQAGNHVLVGAILLNTLFSLFYYMKIARAMYFEASESPSLPTVTIPVILSGICTAGLIFLFIGWGYLNTITLNLLLPLQ
jgi:NADH-quinone oxidoreductase subunit N